MATSPAAINLPPGYSVESSSGLPEGYSVEQQPVPQDQKQLPDATISAGPDGALGWLHNLETDLRHGTTNTFIGKALSKMGAQPIGSPGGPQDTIMSLPLGAIHTAEAATALPQHPGRAALGMAKGALEAGTEPLAFAGGPEVSEAAAAAPGAISRAADAVAGAVPQGVKNFGAEMAQTARPLTDPIKNSMGAIGNFVNKFRVSQDLKTASAAGQNPSTINTAERSVESMNQSVLPELKQSIGREVDHVNASVGHDSTSEASLSGKLSAGGAAHKAKAQELYKQADAIAAEATGQKGAYQRLGQAVEDAKAAAANPAMTNDEKIAAQTRLAGAQKAYDDFNNLAKAKGVNVDKIAGQANKLYSTGLSLEEFGRGVLQSENNAGELLPSRRPLNGVVKQLSTKVGGNRGHVLAQGLGDTRAENVSNAVNKAESQVQSLRDATAAARSTVKAGARADKEIAAIKGRRTKVALGALGAVGAGAARSLYHSQK